MMSRAACLVGLVFCMTACHGVDLCLNLLGTCDDTHDDSLDLLPAVCSEGAFTSVRGTAIDPDHVAAALARGDEDDGQVGDVVVSAEAQTCSFPVTSDGDGGFSLMVVQNAELMLNTSPTGGYTSRTGVPITVGSLALDGVAAFAVREQADGSSSVRAVADAIGRSRLDLLDEGPCLVEVIASHAPPVRGYVAATLELVPGTESYAVLTDAAGHFSAVAATDSPGGRFLVWDPTAHGTAPIPVTVRGAQVSCRPQSGAVSVLRLFAPL
jgi:hypothetical protein